MSKIWKSDGAETKFVEKLFRDGTLKSDAKPKETQKIYQIFNGFSEAVFRKHFGLAKEKCCQNSTFGDVGLNALFVDQEVIQELDGVDGSPEKVPRKNDPHSECNMSINFVQAPVVPVVFTDAVTKQEKCLVVFMLYSGVKDIIVDVIMRDNGPQQTLVVTYKWPSPMYDLVSMFKSDKDGTMLANITSPKVLAIEKALHEYREHMDDAPVASIEIELPVVVDMDPNTWIRTCNKKEDGGAVVFIELECRRKNYIISKNQKCLKIE